MTGIPADWPDMKMKTTNSHTLLGPGSSLKMSLNSTTPYKPSQTIARYHYMNTVN